MITNGGNMEKRGISPIIATVILVVITIALAVGVALWMSGIIGGAGRGEQLGILPDSNMTLLSSTNNTNATIWLHVKNSGSADAQIIAVKLNGVNLPSSDIQTSAPITVKAGSDFNFIINVTSSDVGLTSFTPGTSYQVTIITSAGGSYSTQLTAISK
ncbi:putative, serine protease [Fervidicoccus fontis Kam940]|uniref:Putative, serine protease n=2 Tax=Fervidicoccus fontis TaxID=683846 RepID=I0A126_FERFK|nr:putative, serine protease [Fervidicoccus fontis Kam940]